LKKLRKKPNWVADLKFYVMKNLVTPFEYGKFDCVLFGISCIEAMTGEDLLSGIPKWDNEQEAIKVILKCGKNLKDAANILFKKHKLKEIKINQVTYGDIVITKNKSEFLLSVCVGDNLIAPGKDGLIILPIKGKAWRIG